MRTLAKLFTLKPYGNSLLDGVAETWLLLARLNIVAIAFCDAVAWGYFGYTTMRGVPAYVAAAILGLLVFTLVASVDAMFVMHDRSWGKRSGIRRDHVAIAARVALVVLTFTVTAPFLTQLFFARDIEANIRKQNEQRIASARQDLVGGFGRRIDALRAQLTDRQRDLEKEIAGSGASGRFGRGPTAAAIQREIYALQAEIAATERVKAGEVRSFDTAVDTPEVLANRYGVDLAREGPATRARAVAELKRSASFRATERTIKAFLIFMFLGLVCLKLFQPEAVRIYFSAPLQAAYARMRAGIFNQRLDPREHPEASGMTPIRFADWYENDEQVRDLTERMKTQEDVIRVLGETVRLDIARMDEELGSVSRTGDQLEQQVVALQQELSALKTKIAEEQQALDDFRYDVAADLSLRDQQLLINSRNRTVRHLAEHRTAAAGVTASLNRLTRQLEATRAYENQLRSSVAAAGREVASLTSALQKARQRRVAELTGDRSG